MNHRLLTRLAVAVAAVAPGVVLGGAGVATSISPLVPTSAVYTIDGPDTPLPLTYSTSAEAASVLVTAEGFVSSVDCGANFAVSVSEGAATITNAAGGAIAAATSLPCTVNLGLADGGPASLSVVVSERDEFNAELAGRDQVVTLEQLDVTVTIGDVSLTGGTYHPAEPRSVGDELTRSVTFELAAPRALSFTVPAGTSMTGCVSETAASATCTLTRTLSLADLADGTALVAPTMSVDGFPVALPPADIDVPSERRLRVEATATPDLVRVGEPVVIEIVVTNLGTIDLTDLALSGAGIVGATCGGVDPSTLTLTPGAVVTCTATHLATAADIDAVTPVVARAIAPFGTDSDLVDDDPTSPADIDAVSLSAPYAVLAAEVGAALALGPAVAFVDDAGVDVLPLSLTATSVGALSNAVLRVPLHPASGLTVGGCDQVDADDCVLTLGAVAAGATIARDLDVAVDPGALPLDGVDGLEIHGRLTADGGVAVDASPAVVRTAGVSATPSGDTVEASGASATFDVEIAVAPGHPVAVTVVPSATRPATLTACVDGDAAVTIAESDTGAILGVLDGGSVLTCTFEQAVVETDRTGGAMPVELTLRATAGAAAVERHVTAAVPTTAVVLMPAAAPEPPARGYATTATAERPDRVDYAFEVLVYGDATAGGTLALTAQVGAPDTHSCSDPAGASPARLTCTAIHVITADDLATGTYLAEIGVSVGETSLAAGTVLIEIPFESLEVLVTEISTPDDPDGYGVGDVIRLLVQLRNRGNVPVSLESIDPSLPTSAGLVEAAAACGVGVLAPGATLDCDVAVIVPSGFSGSSVTMTVVTAQFGAVDYTVAVSIDPAPAAEPDPAPTDPEPVVPVDVLPSTGGGSPTSLLPAAFGLCLLGFALRRMTARPA